MNQELAFIQGMEQKEFQHTYEEACKLVVERLKKINEEISLQKDRKYIKDISFRVKEPNSCLS